jgi:hypothetical protein
MYRVSRLQFTPLGTLSIGGVLRLVCITGAGRGGPDAGKQYNARVFSQEKKIEGNECLEL